MAEVPRILLAEDNIDDIELTLLAFKENKLANNITTVRDGEAALDYLYCRGEFAQRPRGNPVLVLLDLKMPKVDGLEVLAAMKKDPKLQSIPVVVLTSSRMESDVVESYNLGVNAYVVKPVDFSEFVNAVKNLGIFWILLNEPPPEVV
ncbi:MAG: response regulator [Candidatus Cloacimonetes bacterium]|nr:response regulator [Candidatus Cloacimonadota bacterium]